MVGVSSNVITLSAPTSVLVILDLNWGTTTTVVQV